MTRNDDLGDNASLTPNDGLGDVHAGPDLYGRKEDLDLAEDLGYEYIHDTRKGIPRDTDEYVLAEKPFTRLGLFVLVHEFKRDAKGRTIVDRARNGVVVTNKLRVIPLKYWIRKVREMGK